MSRLAPIPIRRGAAALAEAERFFMREGLVHQSLRSLTGQLERLAIPYAVAGGMALNAHGYARETTDVGLLVTSESLRKIHAELEGRGYLPPFAGSKNLRDTSTNTRIEFLVAGQFPGDGKPKPVAFPEPTAVAVVIDGIRYINLETLVQLKLASGMSNVGRLKDLADVQELIRVLGLHESFAEDLDPYVRDKFLELHAAVRDNPVVEE
jgi:hypothetical protein